MKMVADDLRNKTIIPGVVGTNWRQGCIIFPGDKGNHMG
jgi:hypothetical protein